MPDTQPYSRLNDRYQILSLIGTGGMASVYRAHDEFLDREVAVKLFNAPLGEIAEVSSQEHELQVLARLNHHGLVTLIDAGIVANKNRARSRMYLVMELVTGSTLKTLIETERLTGLEIAQIGFDIAEGLQYIHGNGVIHRDVKPANMLMVRYGSNDERRRAKLADFGIAVLMETHVTDSGETLGTAAYLSPEQAMRDTILPASDVYSLGLSLLECFTRKNEFPGTQLESATGRLVRDPVIPTTLSAPWAALLSAMTAREPADRPSSTQVVQALGELIGLERKAEASSAEPVGVVPAAATVTEVSSEVFARIARVASRLLNAAIVIIVADENGEPTIVSHVGIDAHLIDQSALLVDPRDSPSPLVPGSSYMRRVTGSVLSGHDNRRLGTIWVLDEQQHVASAYDEQNLADVAALAEREFELSRSTDPAASPQGA
ncbi:serine/threonine-protein kinase [Conyzicola sp.]|uniref:serine/threonine-protein kinase n=1 Tax=Conyzicola sp. TaxID=1969404 RepID=UPI003988C95C